MTAFTPAMADAMRLTRAGRLGEATDRIRAALGGSAPAPASGPVIDLKAARVTYAPAGGDAPEPNRQGVFAAERYEGTAGALGYWLYLPADVRPGMPLVVMLHGCTQGPEDFARGTGMNALADELGFLVAYPGQTQAANVQKCWNWFRPGDQRRDAGEPALIAGMTARIVRGHGVDPARIYVAGLSAGGAAAAIMGAAYPDLYAAVGIHSGLACGAARDLPSALTAMKSGGGRGAGPAGGFVPTITFHGDRDPTVNEVNAREIVAAATAARGAPLTTRAEAGRTAGARDYTRLVSTDPDGRAMIEQWTVHGGGHAWSGGSAAGSYTDPAGPDASRAMLRFFLDHRLAAPVI